MKERPILFSSPMVRALLSGSKTQTRRLLKQPRRKDGAKLLPEMLQALGVGAACPLGAVGDRLWVRETWSSPDGYEVDYRADYPSLETTKGWRPSIFMRRGLSRITLEIVDVRVERLQAITEEDAKAEGATPLRFDPDGDVWSARPEAQKYRSAYEFLWGEINGFAGEGKREGASWDANPWVWVLDFKRVTS